MDYYKDNNYFETSKEFENLIKSKQLTGSKRILVDKKIFSDFKSFNIFSFKLERKNNISSNSSGSRCIKLFNNIDKSINSSYNQFDKEYLENNINYIECDIYLGKNIIILYDFKINLIIFCKYKEFDKINNYHSMMKILTLKYQKLELKEVLNEIKEIDKYDVKKIYI